MTMYPLEASDEYGIQGVKDREDLLNWLESWLTDNDSRECKLEKLINFDSTDYTKNSN
jgi:hypothetical protein